MRKNERDLPVLFAIVWAIMYLAEGGDGALRKAIVYMEVGTGGAYAGSEDPAFLPFAEGVFGDGVAMVEALRRDETGFAKNVDAMARSGFIPSDIMLAANTPRALIRVSEPFASHKRIAPDTRWKMVGEAFPLGDAVNENTHVFDGCAFDNGNGESVFLMAALPVELADAIARFGEALAGKSQRLTRLDTVEHLLFRRFCTESAGDGNRWVVFPQESGLRVLVMEKGLPKATYFLPVLPGLRERALIRTWRANAPESAALLNRPDWVERWDDNRHWVWDFFAGKNIEIKTVVF
jgi:hypothetical protein